MSTNIGRKTFARKNISPSATSSVLNIPPCVFSPEHSVDGAVDNSGAIVTVPAAGTSSAERAESLFTRAKAMGAEVEEAMGKSGNLKREIKSIINKNMMEMLQIMATLVALAKSHPKEGEIGDQCREGSIKTRTVDPNKEPTMVDVLEEVRESRKQIAECALFTRTLIEKLDHKDIRKRPAHPSSPQNQSYAKVAASQQYVPPRPLHSIIISSNDAKDTSSTVVEKIRIAVDAKETGIRVDKVRKARDQKVIIGCQTRQELDIVKSRLGGSAAGLKIEEAVNRDPLVMLTDVLSYNTDDDIARAILKQNQHLMGELKKDEVRVAVKYRRRARNPHESHVVVQVSPPVWQVLTKAGRAHIDLQRVYINT
ncbi:hypothetical protein PYW08_011063 [Mythimna loreyi]|uniref:Uncharacterized protein n=1 Tax=Mythimna loreyi TaxID=667449 RepID=A0ACC2Q4Q3_9NEOP|nr:hypothetical protein PYW08_011063 [Mythimna loreyi]